ncbi:MAG: tRNA (adenosine(37)-N6)-dimethylallyltransferase MiaA [Planctomycetes bacterium]|nr:tRNA (adenosine(37)-N6)-dimethylallyltransferase MiaA [Planctomycetota bacterium]
MQPIPLIVILGPTASGKTSLAVDMAQRYNGEIISADALAVYRGMCIGTAAPSTEEQQGIKHHCLQCIDPSIGCNGQQWFDMAEAAIADIHKRGKIVIVAGGTPLYTKMLLEGISAGAPKDQSVRAQLEKKYEDIGGEAMLKELALVDPTYASERHANDKKRLVRALEVHQITGKPYSAFHTTDGQRRDCFCTLLIGLRWDKEILHKRINARAKKMFADGLVEEVTSLRESLSKQAIEGVGYKEVVKLLDGDYDQEECLYRIKVATRRLAKHQNTWYRKWLDIKWLAGDAEDLSEQTAVLCDTFLNDE